MKATREKSLARNKKLLEDALAILIKGRYFETMTEENLRHVLKEGTYLEVPAGTPLIKEGGLDDDLYFLLAGALEVLSSDKQILKLNTPGDVAGEFAVVSSAPRSADVIAEEPSRLVRVSSSVVKESESRPELASQFLTLFSHIMAAKLRETSRRAKLYEEAVLEVKEIASSQVKLEEEIQDKLQEITLYSKVIETGNDAVVVTDTGGTIQRFNPAAVRMFPQLARKGKRPAKRKMLDLVKKYDLGDYSDQQPDTTWRGEWSLERPDGPLVLQTTASPMPGSEGELVGIAYQLRDVSLQKEQERAIALKNEEIQKALIDLESTYEELQRSDRLKSETLTVVSDELSAPVRRMLTVAERLTEQLADRKDKTVLDNVIAIREQTTYVKAVSDNISQLMEIQQQFQTVSVEPIDLNELLKIVQKELEPVGARKKVGVRVELPDQPMQMAGDAKQIKMVFSLLVEQAIMAARSESRVDVVGSIRDDSQQIRLSIAYRGASFANIRPTQGGAHGRFGTMIGLPLARKAVSKHQGSLQFSGNSRSAQILISLPLAQKEGPERANRIFIVDAEETDHLIVQGVIEYLWPNSVIYATKDPFDFLDNYEDFKSDLVIIDPEISTPGWSNHRLIASLVRNRRHVCPILSISQLYKDFAERTIAVERGVTDFLAKPYSIFDLRFKVKSMLQSYRKEETLHETMDQAQRQAHTDGLTRLANRKHFDAFLEAQINYSKQTRKPCSLVLLDIDNFKHYNDSHGHQMGDEVLKQFGRVLMSSVRASDMAARYGGEEFALVLPETKKDMAAVIAEKVRRSIQESKVPNAEQQPLGFLSASFGVATFSEDGDGPQGLIRAADECLYVAKERGRNVVIKAGGAKKRAAAT
jgi:diguanylate cyclase (GGDEF)-like protein